MGLSQSCPHCSGSSIPSGGSTQPIWRTTILELRQTLFFRFLDVQADVGWVEPFEENHGTDIIWVGIRSSASVGYVSRCTQFIRLLTLVVDATLKGEAGDLRCGCSALNSMSIMLPRVLRPASPWSSAQRRRLHRAPGWIGGSGGSE